MFRSILVGIDEKTRGRDAIALARTLAGAGSQITLAHIDPTRPAPAALGHEIRDRAEHTQQLLTSVAADLGLPARIRSAEATSIAGGLNAIAENVAADLLVVGCTTRSTIARALLGNPTAGALTRAGCTVAVAPAGYADHPDELHRIGVAYDGSGAGEAAIEFASSVARTTGASLSAFEVVASRDGALPPFRHRFDRTVVALAAARNRLDAHENIESHVACGVPVRELCAYSKTVDVLIAASRGSGPLSRLVHPSTTAALAEVVSCPLLVLTKHARERSASDVPHSPPVVTAPAESQ
jgi:nucleotide-binding universal stress UspA family protein